MKAEITHEDGQVEEIELMTDEFIVQKSFAGHFEVVCPDGSKIWAGTKQEAEKRKRDEIYRLNRKPIKFFSL
jgi:hypothetical protein